MLSFDCYQNYKMQAMKVKTTTHINLEVSKMAVDQKEQLQ